VHSIERGFTFNFRGTDWLEVQGELELPPV